MQEITKFEWIPKQIDMKWPAVKIRVDGTELTLHYDIEEGQAVIKQISGDRITSTLLQRARIGTVRRHLTETLREHPERLNLASLFLALGGDDGAGITWDSDEEKRWYEAVAESTRVEMAPRRGRGASNDDLYRQVAILYLATVEWAKQRVIKEMTEIYRSQPEHWNLSTNTVKTWVRRARETGWLTKGTQGKAGAEAGRKLKEWLRLQGDES